MTWTHWGTTDTHENWLFSHTDNAASSHVKRQRNLQRFRGLDARRCVDVALTDAITQGRSA